MPISLRFDSFVRFAAAAAIGSLTLAGCSDGFNASRALSPDAASRSKSANPGNAAKSGAIDVRLLRDGSQHAALYVRTGALDATSGLATPDGALKSLQYKLYDASHKLVRTRNVQFDAPEPSYFSIGVDAAAGWSVSVQANVVSVGGDGTKSDVVRADAEAALLPDISVGQLLLRQSNGTTAPVTAGGSMAANQPITFVVPLLNIAVGTPPAPPTVAEQVACDVTIDGAASSTVAFPNSSNVVTVPAGGGAACAFTTTLSPGTHTIAVTARPITWPDFDSANNSVSVIVTAAAGGSTTAPAVAFGVGGTYQQLQLSPTALFGGDLPAGATYTFSSSDRTIVEVDATGLLTPRGDGSTTIVLAVTVPGTDGRTILVPVEVQVPPPGVCQVHSPPALLPHALNIFIAGEPSRTLTVADLPRSAEVGWSVGNEAATAGGGAHVVALQATATTATITPIAGGAATLTFTEIVNSVQQDAGTGCLVVIGRPDTGPRPSTLAINPATATLTIDANGQTTPLQLSTTLLDDTGLPVASMYDVAWSSGAPNVVSVTDGGLITAHASSATPVTIVARVGALSAATLVTVVDLRTPPPPPAPFTVSPASPSCRVGDQITLAANVPSGTTVSWVLPSSSLGFVAAPTATSLEGTSVNLVCLGPARASGTLVPVTVTANLNDQNTTQTVNVRMTP
jgi:hypothetical protein